MAALTGVRTESTQCERLTKSSVLQRMFLSPALSPVNPTYTSRILDTKPLNLVLLNPRRTVTGSAWAKPEDPQRDPLPLLSLPTSRPRLLQTVYRPILQIFRLRPQCLFLLFRIIHATAASPPPAMTQQGSRDEERMYNLERVEVWETFTRNS